MLLTRQHLPIYRYNYDNQGLQERLTSRVFMVLTFRESENRDYLMQYDMHGSLREETHPHPPLPLRIHVTQSNKWRCHRRLSHLFNQTACLKYCSNICTCIRVCKATSQVPWDKILRNKPSLLKSFKVYFLFMSSFSAIESRILIGILC